MKLSIKDFFIFCAVIGTSPVAVTLRWFLKNLFQKFSRNSQGNICIGILFLVMLHEGVISTIKFVCNSFVAPMLLFRNSFSSTFGSLYVNNFYYFSIFIIDFDTYSNFSVYIWRYQSSQGSSR